MFLYLKNSVCMFVYFLRFVFEFCCCCEGMYLIYLQNLHIFEKIVFEESSDWYRTCSYGIILKIQWSFILNSQWQSQFDSDLHLNQSAVQPQFLLFRASASAQGKQIYHFTWQVTVTAVCLCTACLLCYLIMWLLACSYILNIKHSNCSCIGDFIAKLVLWK